MLIYELSRQIGIPTSLFKINLGVGTYELYE